MFIDEKLTKIISFLKDWLKKLNVSDELTLLIRILSGIAFFIIVTTFRNLKIIDILILMVVLFFYKFLLRFIIEFLIFFQSLFRNWNALFKIIINFWSFLFLMIISIGFSIDYVDKRFANYSDIANSFILILISLFLMSVFSFVYIYVYMKYYNNEKTNIVITLILNFLTKIIFVAIIGLFDPVMQIIEEILIASELNLPLSFEVFSKILIYWVFVLVLCYQQIHEVMPKLIQNNKV